MDEITITVHLFRMGTDKEAALKPLEEASEVHAAWQNMLACNAYDGAESIYHQVWFELFADEIADCIQPESRKKLTG